MEELENRIKEVFEKIKIGPFDELKQDDIKNALTQINAPYIYIDDFCTGNCYDITTSVILSEIRSKLNDIVSINMYEMLNNICKELRVNMNQNEIPQKENKIKEGYTLIWGSDPTDLDSHIYSFNQIFEQQQHVYYPDRYDTTGYISEPSKIKLDIPIFI